MTPRQREARRETMRRWRKNNPERNRELGRRWYARNKEKKSAQVRAYYAAHRETIIEKKKCYRDAHAAKLATKARERYHDTKKMTVKQIRAYYETPICWRCDEPMTKPSHDGQCGACRSQFRRPGQRRHTSLAY